MTFSVYRERERIFWVQFTFCSPNFNHITFCSLNHFNTQIFYLLHLTPCIIFLFGAVKSFHYYNDKNGHDAVKIINLI